MLLLPAWHMAGYQGPKCLGVILLHRMAKLMDNDVILHAGRQFHHPRMKLQGVVRITAGPATLEVTDTSSIGLQTGLTLPMANTHQ